MEDDATIRTLVALVLMDEGYTVATAPHGAAALERLGHDTPALILLDMHMPVMDGWAFMAALRRRPGPHLPVLVMTAALDARRWAAEVGADGFLAKPFDVDDLLTRVGHLAHLAHLATV